MAELDNTQLGNLIFDKIVPETPQEPTPPAPDAAPADSGAQPPAATPEPPSTPQEPDYNSFLKEKTGGKVDSVEALMKVIEQANAPRETQQFANDESKALYEMIASGKMNEAYSVLEKKVRLSGLETMSAEQAIKLSFQFKYPGLTPAQIEQYYQNEFGVDEDNLTEADAQKQRDSVEIKKIIQAGEAKAFLQQKNKEIVFPTIQQPEKDWTEVVPKEISDYLNQVNSFSESFSQAVAKAAPLEKISFTFKDKGVDGSDKVYFQNDFAVTPEENAALDKEVSNYFGFIENKYANGGNYDVNAMKRDIYLLNNYEKIVQAQVKKALGDSANGILKDIKNFDNTQINSGGTPQVDPGRAVIENVILGGGRN